MIHLSFVYMVSLTVLFLVIFFALSQLKTDKQQKIQCTESYILFERKVLLEQITPSAQANTPLAFKIQKTL